jgi:hypothetical protein
MMMMSRYRQVALVGGASAVITHTSATNSEPQHQKMQLVFLGTGSSIGCPRPVCATKDPLKDAPAWSSVCRNSWKALVGDPRHNSNYRNNPSLLVRVPTPTGVDGYTNIVIDAGKTFREAVIRWFPHQSPPVAGVDAVILTHEHADAMLGEFLGRPRSDDRSVRFSAWMSHSITCCYICNHRSETLTPLPPFP